MIGKTNAGTGKCVALIHAFYKAGTDCTCTKGTRVFHSDSSGEYVFLLPETGEWTVAGKSATDEDKSITVTVGRGEAKLITLDTLIPPADRETYQEVEYLQIIDATGSIPLGVNCGTGLWQYEIEEFTPVELTGVNVIGTYTSGSSGAGLWMTSGKPQLRYGDANTTSASSMVQNITKKLTLTFKDCVQGHSFTTPYATMAFDDTEELIISSTERLNAKEITVGWITDGTARDGFRAKYSRITVKHKDAEDGEFTLIGDFIPCVERPTAPDVNGLPGYYNLVTNTFVQAKKRTTTTKADVLTAVSAGPAIGT